MGNIHFKTGQYNKAIKYYRMALDQVGPPLDGVILHSTQTGQVARCSLLRQGTPDRSNILADMENVLPTYTKYIL